MTQKQHNPQQWQRAKAEVREIVIGVAKAGTSISYGELAGMLQTMTFHPRAYSYHLLLREICVEEEAVGRGFLCALVVRKATGLPGNGYFRFAAQHGRDVSNPLHCWQQEVQRLYTIWQTQDRD